MSNPIDRAIEEASKRCREQLAAIRPVPWWVRLAALWTGTS